MPASQTKDLLTIACIAISSVALTACSDSDLIVANNPSTSDSSPVFSPDTVTINVAEDSTGVIYTASASDADGNELSYAIDGDDASKFSIGTSSGELQFISPPDYENPDDVNMDRVYQLTISASDDLSKGHMSLSVNITDANDPPVAAPATDQSAIMGSLVSLDGSASSNSDGTITDYSWQLINPNIELELSGANQAHASFIAPAVTSTTSYTLRLTVTDDDQTSNSAEISISVAPIIIPSDFSAEAGENNSTLSWSVQSQELVYNLYRSSDPDCDLANYSNCPNPALYLDASSGLVDSNTAAGSTYYYYWLEAQSGALVAYSDAPQAANPYAYNPKCFLEAFNEEDLIQAQEYNANLPIDKLCRIYQSHVGSEALISVERITSAIGHNAQIHPHNIAQIWSDSGTIESALFLDDLAFDIEISRQLGKDTAWFIVRPEVAFFDSYKYDPDEVKYGGNTINAEMIQIFRDGLQIIRENNMIAIAGMTYDATCDVLETAEGYERRQFILNTFLREMWDDADVLALAEFSEAFWDCRGDNEFPWVYPYSDVWAAMLRPTIGRMALDIDEDLAKRFLFIFHGNEIFDGWVQDEVSIEPGAYNIKSFGYYAHGTKEPLNKSPNLPDLS